MRTRWPGVYVIQTDKTMSEPLPGGRYRVIALAVVMMGVTMSAVDTTAVVLGLPVMMNDLRSDIVSMIWVIMAYLLVITVLGTQVGRLGDMYGRVRTYNLGFHFHSRFTAVRHLVVGGGTHTVQGGAGIRGRPDCVKQRGNNR